MIIPTLRIANRSHYDEIVEVYKRQGISAVRVNMTRHSLERYFDDIMYLRKIYRDQLQILADIPVPGQKYRITTESDQLTVAKGDSVCFTTSGKGTRGSLTVDIDVFPENVLGKKILIGDGELSLRVTEAEAFRLTAVANNSAVIRNGRAFVAPGAILYKELDDALLENYVNILERIEPDKIVLSFSEDLQKLQEVESRVKKNLSETVLVPKIETQRGVDNFAEIASKYGEIMLGRGDLALFGDPCDLAANQDRVIRSARNANANVIVATGILSSLYTSVIPERGELTDLYYLKSMQVKDIVASAGISTDTELFSRFCTYAHEFRD